MILGYPILSLYSSPFSDNQVVLLLNSFTATVDLFLIFFHSTADIHFLIHQLLHNSTPLTWQSPLGMRLSSFFETNKIIGFSLEKRSRRNKQGEPSECRKVVKRRRRKKKAHKIGMRPEMVEEGG